MTRLQARAAYDRFLIAEYRYQRYHRRWDLLVGFLAYAVPLTMIATVAAYYLEIL